LPTDPAPPKIKIGQPLYLEYPPRSQGGMRLIPLTVPYNPIAAVLIPHDMVDAWSNDKLLGILAAKSVVTTENCWKVAKSLSSKAPWKNLDHG